MIALPYHPSCVYTIDEVNADPEGLLREVEERARVSSVIHLADVVSTLIRPAEPILHQAETIRKTIVSLRGREFSEEAVDAFLSVSGREYVWMDIRYYPQFLKFFTGSIRDVSLDRAVELTGLMSRIIDYRSSFTAMHSAGVAATAEALAESAENQVRLIESMGYDQLVVSIKSSDVMMCVDAYRRFAGRTPYPLHVGITEAGTVTSGNIKSAIGLGLILSAGIGDTIRVSLTGDPAEEIRSAQIILRTLGLRKGGVEIVSCPTCGRTKIDLISLADQAEKLAAGYPDLNLKIAVMGCVVNGPGEAKEADFGIAGGDGCGVLIEKGQIVKTVPEDQLLNVLREELDRMRGRQDAKEEL